MLGILGVAWSIWRWRDGSVEICGFEGFVRLIFAAAMGWAAIQTGSELFAVFAIIDIVAGSLHIAAWLGRNHALEPRAGSNFQEYPYSQKITK